MVELVAVFILGAVFGALIYSAWTADIPRDQIESDRRPR